MLQQGRQATWTSGPLTFFFCQNLFLFLFWFSSARPSALQAFDTPLGKVQLPVQAQRQEDIFEVNSGSSGVIMAFDGSQCLSHCRSFCQLFISQICPSSCSRREPNDFQRAFALLQLCMQVIDQMQTANETSRSSRLRAVPYQTRPCGLWPWRGVTPVPD